MDTLGLETLLAVTLVAALAPMVVAVLPGPRIPQVVILILAGILIGPHVLGLEYTPSVRLIANVGLGFLFLLAGYELDPLLLREHAGKLAIGGWVISAVIAVAAVAGLVSVGYVRDFVPIGLALTTTALGTLLPILHDNDMLSGKFGRYILAAGAVGELFPIVAISLFLTPPQRVLLIAIASDRGRGRSSDPADDPAEDHRRHRAPSHHPAGPAGDRADDSALVDRLAFGLAGGRGKVRAGCGPGRDAGWDGAAQLDQADGSRRHALGRKARRGRLRLSHPRFLRGLRDDSRYPSPSPRTRCGW